MMVQHITHSSYKYNHNEPSHHRGAYVGRSHLVPHSKEGGRNYASTETVQPHRNCTTPQILLQLATPRELHKFSTKTHNNRATRQKLHNSTETAPKQGTLQGNKGGTCDAGWSPTAPSAPRASTSVAAASTSACGRDSRAGTVGAAAARTAPTKARGPRSIGLLVCAAAARLRSLQRGTQTFSYNPLPNQVHIRSTA